MASATVNALDREAAAYRGGHRPELFHHETHATEPTCRLMTVTPEQAQAWLQKAHRNRSISSTRVKALASAIARGLWCVNGQTIVLCPQGRLLDGQHRLRAVIEANRSIETMVVYGIDARAFITIDQSRKRLAADILSIEGQKQPHTLASALRWLWRYEHHAMPQAGIALHDYELPGYLAAHQGLLHALSWGHTLQAFLPPGCASMVYYVMQDKDPLLAKQFFAHLAKGTGLEASNPAYQVRESFLHTKREMNHQRVCEKAAIMVQAWNCLRQQIPMRAVKLKWHGDGSAFPVVA